MERSCPFVIAIVFGFFILLSGIVIIDADSTDSEPFIVDGIKYEKTSDTEVEVVSNGYSGNIIISSSVTFSGKDYSVTSVGNQAFMDCTSLSSITIPNSVKHIGNYAFKECTSLSSVDLGNGVISIGSYAFYHCQVISVAIPGSVTDLGDYAFARCGSLVSATISYGIIEINENTFWCCKVLKSVTIPDSVKTINSSAFAECISLSSVIIPDSVTSIGFFAFGECLSLSSAILPNHVTDIGSYAFAECISLISVTVPKSITNIGNSAFKGCRFFDLDGKTEINYYYQLPGYRYTGESSSKLIRVYNVHFDENGGSVKIVGFDIDEGAEFNLPEYTGVKTGCTFGGWSYGGKVYQAGQNMTKVCSDMTFTALWTVTQYKATFMNCGKIYSSEIYNYNSIIKAPDVAPVKESTDRYDYLFSKWDGFTEGMKITKDMTFNAVYDEKPRQYMVKFFSEGNLFESRSLEYDSLIKVPKDIPVKESTAQYSYTFQKWGGFTDGMEVTGNHTFEALFDEKARIYTISFISEGKVFESKSLSYGTQITKPTNNPSKDPDDVYKYVFTSWSGFNEDLIVTGDHIFDAMFKGVIKNISTSEKKLVIDVNSVDNVNVSSEIIDQIKSAGKSTEIILSNGRIVLDSVSATGLSDGEKEIAFGDAVRSEIFSEINEKIGDRPVYSIRFGNVHEFSGTLTISIRYELKEGENADDLCIWYLKDDGTYDPIDCRYSDGSVVFKTTHLSNYAVMINESEHTENSSDSFIPIIAGAVAEIAFIVLAAFLMIRRVQ